MSADTTKMLRSDLEMEEDDLLFEIGHRQRIEGVFYSPESLIKKAKETLYNLLPEIRKKICDKKELEGLDELTLALDILAVVSQRVEIGVASAVAAYLAKRGLEALCKDQNN